MPPDLKGSELWSEYNNSLKEIYQFDRKTKNIYQGCILYVWVYTLHISIPAMENEDEKQQSSSSFFENRSYANKRDII